MKYTPTELHNKVQKLKLELDNPLLSKQEIETLQTTLKNHINKLAELEQNPSLKTISI